MGPASSFTDETSFRNFLPPKNCRKNGRRCSSPGGRGCTQEVQRKEVPLPARRSLASGRIIYSINCYHFLIAIYIIFLQAASCLLSRKSRVAACLRPPGLLPLAEANRPAVDRRNE